MSPCPTAFLVLSPARDDDPEGSSSDETSTTVVVGRGLEAVPHVVPAAPAETGVPRDLGVARRFLS